MIKKEVEVKVLNETADIALVKEYREAEDIYVFDLVKSVEEKKGDITDITYQILAQNRYAKVKDAPFTLTEDELEELIGGENDN